jgi:hypothetical protein
VSIADRIISELVYDRTQTFPETRYTPAEYTLYCAECRREDGDEHRDGCKLVAVEEFLNKYGHTIERWVTA